MQVDRKVTRSPSQDCARRRASLDENQMGEFKMALAGRQREGEKEGEEFGYDGNGKLLSEWRGICQIETVTRPPPLSLI